MLGARSLPRRSCCGVRRGLRQPRDAPRGLTLVDDALGRRLGDLANRGRELLLGLRRIAGGRRLAELADAGAERGEDVRVADAVLLRLPVLLLCRTGIGHRGLQKKDDFLSAEGPSRIAPGPCTVNAGRRWGNLPRVTGFPLGRSTHAAIGRGLSQPGATLFSR